MSRIHWGWKNEKSSSLNTSLLYPCIKCLVQLLCFKKSAELFSLIKLVIWAEHFFISWQPVSTHKGRGDFGLNPNWNHRKILWRVQSCPPSSLFKILRSIPVKSWNLGHFGTGLVYRSRRVIDREILWSAQKILQQSSVKITKLLKRNWSIYEKIEVEFFFFFQSSSGEHQILKRKKSTH